MKTIEDALKIRRRIFGAFELAESADDPAERARWLTFAPAAGKPRAANAGAGARPLKDANISLSAIFGFTAIIAAAMALLSFFVTRRRPVPADRDCRQSQDRDRVDRRAGAGGQPERRDDAQERPASGRLHTPGPAR